MHLPNFKVKYYVSTLVNQCRKLCTTFLITNYIGFMMPTDESHYKLKFHVCSITSVRARTLKTHILTAHKATCSFSQFKTVPLRLYRLRVSLQKTFEYIALNTYADNPVHLYIVFKRSFICWGRKLYLLSFTDSARWWVICKRWFHFSEITITSVAATLFLLLTSPRITVE